MNIAIISAWDKKYDALANITSPNHKMYCDKHGYELVTVNNWEGTWEGRGPQWSRLDVARKTLHRFDAIFIIDIDMIITNMNIKIEDLATHDFVCTYDVNGFNAASIILKNTEWAINFIDKYWTVGNRYLNFPNPEQTCMAHLLICEPKDKWDIKPQRTMNSFPYQYYEDLDFPEGTWAPEDFILHTPALPLEQRIEILGKAI